MKTEKEIKAFVAAYANCIAYVNSPTVETIALMLSADYNEGVITDRFDGAQSVIDAYYLWDQARPRPVCDVEMYRPSQYPNWEHAAACGGVYKTSVHTTDDAVIADVLNAITTAADMCEGGEEVITRICKTTKE
jgi:hypothetical protein